MSTVLVVLATIFVLASCGLGPSLLLLPRGETGLRILGTLPLGLSTGVVASMGLAWLGLTGRVIAVVDVALFALLAAIGVWARPPSRRELAGAAAPLAIAVAGTLLLAWPLLQETHYRYVGYGNPDVPGFLQQAMYLDGHPFGMYKDVPRAVDFYRGVQPQLTLGMLYLLSMASLLTGSAIHTLFGVACAASAFMVPVAVYLLAEDGLRLPRSTALLAALVTAGSSVLAHNFYLHSLGTLTTMAMLPAALAFTALCLAAPTAGRVLVVALIGAGIFHNYHAGAGLVAACLAALTLHELAHRRVSLRTAAVVAGAGVGLTLGVFLPHALDILRIMGLELVTAKRLAWDNEIQGFFGLALTEHLVPHAWGLKVTTQSPATLTAGLGVALLVLGLSCVALLVMACSTRLSRLPGSYAWVMAAVFLLLALYGARGAGYAVFKLTAWAHPLLVVGLVAGALGVSERLRGRLGRLPGAVLLGLLAVVFAWNVRQVVVLGGHGALRITKGITLEDYAELRAVGGAPERARIVAALSDPVVQRWVDAFLPRTRREFLPPLSLAVRDSGPMSPADLARYVSTPGPIETGVVVLRRVDEKGDAGAPVPALWQNRVFALSALPTVHGALVFGRGWYRVEESDASPFPFVRRFRWLRKRGELFVLNGQGRERRLRLKIVAGPGNGDVFRRLRLYHNGAQIDDIRILTYAQLYSRPLRLDGPLEQIELETVEDGRPLPRPRPLWGPWVAADPRRLTVGVAGVELVAADESRVRAAELDFTDPAQVVDGTFEGVHRDRWMGHAATVTLRVPQAARAIRLRGAAPGGAGLPYPLSIRLGADGVSLGVAWLQEAGEFDVLVPLRDRLQAGTQVALKLEVAATFSGLDPRPLSLRLESVGFTTAFPDGRADGVAAPAPRVPTPSLRR